MNIEAIILRGGPAPDTRMEWSGGDEVIMPHLVGGARFQYLKYLRSEDDPARFDFVKVIYLSPDPPEESTFL